MPDMLTLNRLRDDLANIDLQLSKAEVPFTLRAMLQARKKDLEASIILEGEADRAVATVALMWGGGAGVGGAGLGVGFLSKALDRFQVFVSNIYAEMIADRVAERGPIRGRDQSRLFIQDVVHGSMGFVLSEEPKEQAEAFSTGMNQALSRALVVIDKSASANADDFERVIDETSPRSIASLTRLTDVFRGSKATVRFASDEIDRQLTSSDVERMFVRLHDVAQVEEPAFISGELRGIFPERAEYEFVGLDGSISHGRVQPDLIERYLSEPGFRETFIAKRVVAQFRCTTVRRAGQPDRSDYLLEAILIEPALGQSTRTQLE